MADVILKFFANEFNRLFWIAVAVLFACTAGFWTSLPPEGKTVMAGLAVYSLTRVRGEGTKNNPSK
jgi:hypothetical protein